MHEINIPFRELIAHACMIPVTGCGMPQSKVPGSGDHPLLPQVEILTSLSPLQVKVSMDPLIVTGGVFVMVTPAAVDGVGHTTVLQRRNVNNV